VVEEARDNKNMRVLFVSSCFKQNTNKKARRISAPGLIL